jgi:hypothetical protein
MLQKLERFVDDIRGSDVGRGLAGAFDGAIQLRWVADPIDPQDIGWFGGDDGSWVCLETRDGEITVVEGDRRADHEWRRCVLIETDEATLAGVLDGTIRPLDAYLGDRLHIGHFCVAGVQGQWALALLAYGQRAAGNPPFLPARRHKRFMTFDYQARAEQRRAELQSRIQG